MKSNFRSLFATMTTVNIVSSVALTLPIGLLVSGCGNGDALNSAAYGPREAEYSVDDEFQFDASPNGEATDHLLLMFRTDPGFLSLDRAASARGYAPRTDYAVSYSSTDGTGTASAVSVTLLPYEVADDSADALYIIASSREGIVTVGSFFLRTQPPAPSDSRDFEFVDGPNI